MNSTQILSVLSITIAAAAWFLSWMTFRRQKSLENENHFFKYKLDQYQIIIQKIVDLHSYYQDIIFEVGKMPQEKDTIAKYLDGKADLIDEKTDRFRLILLTNCAFIPQELITRLDKYYDQLYGQAEQLESQNITLELINKLASAIEQYEEEFQKIINLMRKDLGIEGLDKRLKLRTHK